MPIVQHSDLPTFSRLIAEGRQVLPQGRAQNQDIRELHVGFLNIMPDAALEATERQFFRLISESSRIVQIYIHPFTLPELPRGNEAQAHIEKYYEPFDILQDEGLDALIITGANVTNPDLQNEPFWNPLDNVLKWAMENVTSTLCSCLTTHAMLQMRYGQERQALPAKRWGVFSHRVTDRSHPLVCNINTVFDVPHSRHNEIRREQFEAAGMRILAESDEAGVHMATSPDGFRMLCFQGHPEYDMVSLLKEYKRETLRFLDGERKEYPLFPEHYFSEQAQDLLNSFYYQRVDMGQEDVSFPDAEILPLLENTWADTARSVISGWIGHVYQTTHVNRKIPFMDGIDPENPLGLK